jgi:single-stranded DNA-specific DHH superfamily exonuclease
MATVDTTTVTLTVNGREVTVAKGLSLVEALRQCACHLEKFGGHEMAAGLTVQEGRFEDFRRALGARLG